MSNSAGGRIDRLAHDTGNGSEPPLRPRPKTPPTEARRVGGVVRLRAFAVLRLITSSTLVGRQQHRKFGWFFAPTMRPVYTPAWRYPSATLAP